MHLTPRKVDKLISFASGEVARRRRARGLKPIMTRCRTGFPTLQHFHQTQK
jgi:urease gamma subunit